MFYPRTAVITAECSAILYYSLWGPRLLSLGKMANLLISTYILPLKSKLSWTIVYQGISFEKRLTISYLDVEIQYVGRTFICQCRLQMSLTFTFSTAKICSLLRAKIFPGSFLSTIRSSQIKTFSFGRHG